MAAKRFYYSDTISDFLSRDEKEIIADLGINSHQDVNDETRKSWLEEIRTLREPLVPYVGRGSIYFEYNIPRMGGRADVIVLIDGVVFVLEYKTSDQKFTHAAEVQVWDYAIDLKNFQDGSLDRIMIPILGDQGDRSLIFFSKKFVNSHNKLYLCSVFV